MDNYLKGIIKEIKQHEDKIKETTSKTTFKIVIHNPDLVDMNRDIMNEKSQMFEVYKEFDSRSKAKEWLADYIEIIEMLD